MESPVHLAEGNSANERQIKKNGNFGFSVGVNFLFAKKNKFLLRILKSMSNVSVNFNILLANHLMAVQNKVTQLVGGSLKREFDGWASQGIHQETCCVELSFAFHHSGAGINNNNNSLTVPKIRTFWTGQNGIDIYIIAVPEMRAYLDHEYGVSENYKGGKKSDYTAIVGRTGIIALGNRHISVWDGHNYTLENTFLDLWGDAVFQRGSHVGELINESAHIRGIFFWEITSEWGF
jgi:hypothetical protein